MQHNRIFLALTCVLAAACLILSVSLFRAHRSMEYLPDSTVDDMVRILEQSDIRIDPAIISTKREKGTVYVCDSADYSKNVAELVGGSPLKALYTVPEGEILILENGARFDFGSDFSFRYYRDGKNAESAQTFAFGSLTGQLSEGKRGEVAEVVREFLERGSLKFEGAAQVEVLTEAEYIWEEEGVCYALCTRSIDGIAIADNAVLCALENGAVTEAYGTWCFFTPGDSYSAQLSDLFNILFNVKKAIEDDRDEAKTVTIEDVSLCYSLYFYGEEENFCLIPCWQISTDSMGEYIYNAIDSTLYTKN